MSNENATKALDRAVEYGLVPVVVMDDAGMADGQAAPSWLFIL